MIVPKHYENLKVLHENTMPARAYYIPASERMDTLVLRREDSDRMQMLNGDWRFRYYKSVSELTDAFYQMDYDVQSFDTVKVPGVWQMAGYEYTSIPIFVTHFLLTHLMFLRIIHVELMYRNFFTTKIREHQRYI